MQITQRPYTAPKMAARAQVKPQAKPVVFGSAGQGMGRMTPEEADKVVKFLGSHAKGAAKGTLAGAEGCAEIGAEAGRKFSHDCPEIVQEGVAMVTGTAGAVVGGVAGFFIGLFGGDD